MSRIGMGFVVGALLIGFFTNSLCLGQDMFVNQETPHVKPIVVATLNPGPNEYDVVLACNTQDDSVEIYLADDLSFVRRMPVGLGPVTVRWNPGRQSFYTCNHDGDSVTQVSLVGTGTRANPVITANLVKTVYVGDEPSDIVFDGSNQTCIITLASRSSFTQLSLTDLSVLVYPSRVKPTVDGTRPVPRVIKSPRTMNITSDDRWFVINYMSDIFPGTLGAPFYGADALYFDPGIQGAPTSGILEGMGSAHYVSEMNSQENLVFVVGASAQIASAFSETAVAALPFGFVESMLWVVDYPSGQVPTVRGLAAVGPGPSPTLQSVNLNRDPLTGAPVAAADALAQPADVLLMEDSNGAVQSVVIAAFHSDRVAFLDVDPNAPGGYVIRRVNLHAPAAPYSVVGPHGLAYSPNAVDNESGVQGILFVLNRLDNTISLVDPSTATEIRSVSLQNDPAPDAIKAGRKFLYSAKLSENGFVSCASCHEYGRTDGLIWGLGNANEQVTIPNWLHDNHFAPANPPPNMMFPNPKGLMTTQTLQGLVTHPMNAEAQALFTSGPYHWRGDRQTFRDFRGAFVSLMSTTVGRPNPVSTADMFVYEGFINTIVHPPNPEQPLDRKVSGSLGANPNDMSQGSGALLGLKIFHNQSLANLNNRSCKDCHSLPDGSNNRLSLAIASAPGGPMETAETRNLGLREMWLHDDFSGTPTAQCSLVGLLHDGNSFSGSTNRFLINAFRAFMPNQTNPDPQIQSVVEFIRQQDSGIAPAVGFHFTLLPTTGPSGPINDIVNDFLLGILEDQVLEANIGLALYTRESGQEHGYWFDITANPPAYREEGTSILRTRAYIRAIAGVSADVAVAKGTPVGSERRVASLTGQATLIVGGGPPTGVTLMPMAPPTHWKDVPLFDGNPIGTTVLESILVHLRNEARAAQIRIGGTTPAFGLADRQKEEGPRRFRVSADSGTIRPGAWLLLKVPTSLPGPGATGIPIVARLHPTRYRDGTKQIWEATVELDEEMTLTFLNGGPFAPNVLSVLRPTTPEVVQTLTLQGDIWNLYEVNVVNEDGSNTGLPSSNNWQRLRIQDTR